MFFFFAGGINQQVRQVLKSGAGKCISCGSKADLVEYEKVLKLFFVPVWRWPGKDQMMHCNNCSLFFPPSLLSRSGTVPPIPGLVVPDALRCRSCARSVDPEFSFCPYCGVAM